MRRKTGPLSHASGGSLTSGSRWIVRFQPLAMLLFLQPGLVWSHACALTEPADELVGNCLRQIARHASASFPDLKSGPSRSPLRAGPYALCLDKLNIGASVAQFA